MRRSKYVFVYTVCLYVTLATEALSNETCGCYMLGTLSSIDDESLCDNQTLQCRCHQNVIGKNCDKCADGFYDIISGRGCTSCQCHPLGAIEKSCGVLTGQCRCKPGFIGLRCDHCKPHTYQSSPEECLKCNCNLYGSENLRCNITGQCSCLPNTEGKQCQRCKENTYDIEQGCVPCPPCFRFVQNAISNYTKYINAMEQALEQVEDELPLHIQEFQHFRNEIILLKAKINKLQLQYEDVNSTSGQDAINELSKQIVEFRNQLVGLIEEFEQIPQYKEIESVLDLADSSLEEANSLVVTCEGALANATKLSRYLKRHNKAITKIAKDALAKVEEIENKVEELDQLLLDTTNSCNESCGAAETYLKIQADLQNEIEDIQTHVLNTSSGLDTIKNYLEGFHQETKASKEKSTQLEKEALDLDIPVTEPLDKELKLVHNGLEEINLVMQDVTSDADKINEKKLSGEAALEITKTKQKAIDDTFALVKEYDKRADVAINNTNNILTSAQESLNRIEEYTRIKNSAEEAMNKISEVRAKIDAVTDHSKEIQDIFDELFGVIIAMEKMQLNLSEIIKSNKAKQIDFNKNLITLEELEAMAKQQSEQLEESHAKLKSVRSNIGNLKEFQAEIEYNITRMLEYILVLDTLPTSEEQLDEVEQEIRTMEEMVWTTEYLIEEKEKLEKEVDNVKRIIESIPIDDSNLCGTAESEPKQN